MNAKIRYKELDFLKRALKITVASSAAIYIAMQLDLQFATSAGIIALLSVATTKVETVRLSIYRIISYMFTVVLSIIAFQMIDSIWLAYGLFILIIAFCTDYIGWSATLSVNAVIGTHYLSTLDFSMSFIVNELLLVIIGISMAIILNIFNSNKINQKRLNHNMDYTEEKLQSILIHLAKYLVGETKHEDVWEEVDELEREIEFFIEQACEYNNNTFNQESDYYEHYFEMRLIQLSIIHNISYDMNKMRSVPTNSKIISEFIIKISENVFSYDKLNYKIDEFKENYIDILLTQVPNSAAEFEEKARLYHIMMDLEELLLCKQHFIESNAGKKLYSK